MSESMTWIPSGLLGKHCAPAVGDKPAEAQEGVALAVNPAGDSLLFVSRKDGSMFWLDMKFFKADTRLMPSAEEILRGMDEEVEGEGDIIETPQPQPPFGVRRRGARGPMA